MKNLKNNDVLYYFSRGTESASNSGKNLTIVNFELYSYNTPIAKNYGYIVLVNGTSYSSTTSKHQNWLKNNEQCLVVDAETYKFFREQESDEAYDLIHTIHNELKEENGTVINMLLTTKKGKALRDKVMSIIYANNK